MKGKGKGRSKGFKGKGDPKGSSKGKGKGFGKGGKGKGNQGTGCFNCGSQSHWSRNCPHARQSSVVEESIAAAASSDSNQAEDWTWDWSDSWHEGPEDWSDWNDFQGALYEDDWSYWDDSWYDWNEYSNDWPDDWHWPPQSVSDSSALPSSVQITEIADKTTPAATAAAITTEVIAGDCPQSSASSDPSSDFNNSRRRIGTQRTARPGLMSKLFVGALMLVGTVSSSAPHCPHHGFVCGANETLDSIESSSSSEIAQNPLDIATDKLSEFHVQSGIVDKSWILFDSGASANCCPDWFGQDYPFVLHCAASQVRHWTFLAEESLKLIVMVILCVFNSMYAKAFLSHLLVFLDFCCRIFGPL